MARASLNGGAATAVPERDRHVERRTAATGCAEMRDPEDLHEARDEVVREPLAKSASHVASRRDAMTASASEIGTLGPASATFVSWLTPASADVSRYTSLQ